MPMALVLREFVRASTEFAGDALRGVRRVVLETTDSEECWRQSILPCLARRFGVSTTAMAIRVSEVRLADGKPLLPEVFAQRVLVGSRIPIPTAASFETGQ